VYLALGVKMVGEKEILGLWMGPTEGLFYALRYS
jgi:transposase-like protein